MFFSGTNKFYPNDVMGWVHVEDVANAHLLAYENEPASGRYLCIEDWRHWREVAEFLRELEPSAPITDRFTYLFTKTINVTYVLSIVVSSLFMLVTGW